jgi:hypothetical protein
MYKTRLTYFVLVFFVGFSAAFAIHEAGWDVDRWCVHFTVLFNEECDEFEDYSVWRGDGVEYYLMRFDTPDPEFAREVHMKTGYLYGEEIIAEKELEESVSKGFESGLETDYLYGDGEYRELVWYLSDGKKCYALIFSCPADEWDENEFYRNDFFSSVSKY